VSDPPLSSVGAERDWLPLEATPPLASEVLDCVLLPLCRRHGIPLLLRMGTRRGMNASLRLAGDGVGAARLDALAALCAAHPQNKFLVTVLSASEQHEAAGTQSSQP
jgi:hypothetical protein